MKYTHITVTKSKREKCSNQSLVQVFFFLFFFSSHLLFLEAGLLVVLGHCCCIALFVVNETRWWVRMGGTIRRRHDGEWFHCDEGKSMLGLLGAALTERGGGLAQRWTNGSNGLQYYLLLLDMAYWVCFCWRSSVMASSFFSTCWTTGKAESDYFLERGVSCEESRVVALGAWPAVRPVRCSECAARPSAWHRPRAAQPSPATGPPWTTLVVQGDQGHSTNTDHHHHMF